MAENRPKSEIPESLLAQVKQVGPAVSSEEVDTYGKLRAIEDRSHRTRAIVKAWKDQQTQDRKLRQQYAHWLMAAMAAQAAAINVVFVLLGCGVLIVEPWTARAFIMAVFAPRLQPWYFWL